MTAKHDRPPSTPTLQLSQNTVGFRTVQLNAVLLPADPTNTAIVTTRDKSKLAPFKAVPTTVSPHSLFFIAPAVRISPLEDNADTLCKFRSLYFVQPNLLLQIVSF